MEIRPVPSLPGYFASDDGRIFSERRGSRKEMKQSTATPYRTLSVRDNGRSRLGIVHRMVCEAFYGPPAQGCEARHKNGNKHDNRSDNLEWGTRTDNEHDKRRHGTDNTGARNGRALLNAEQVSEICRRVESGEVQTNLASEYMVSRSTINAVVAGANWRSLCSGAADTTSRLSNHGERHHMAKLTEDDVREIRRQINAGVPVPALARVYGVWPTSIRNIATRHTWKRVA